MCGADFCLRLIEIVLTCGYFQYFPQQPHRFVLRTMKKCEGSKEKDSYPLFLRSFLQLYVHDEQLLQQVLPRFLLRRQCMTANTTAAAITIISIISVKFIFRQLL